MHTVKLANVVAVKVGRIDDQSVICLRKVSSPSGDDGETMSVGTATSFTVWVARHVGRHRWRHHKVVFRALDDQNIASQWVDRINEVLSGHGSYSLFYFF